MCIRDRYIVVLKYKIDITQLYSSKERTELIFETDRPLFPSLMSMKTKTLLTKFVLLHKYIFFKKLISLLML